MIKFGALAFILFLPTTDAINFQLLGGIWIIQTLPIVFLGLYTHWFHRYALAIGLIGGLIVGTWMVVIQNFVSSIYTISIAGIRIPVYAAVSALVVNLVFCVVLTLLFGLLVPRQEGMAQDQQTLTRTLFSALERPRWKLRLAEVLVSMTLPSRRRRTS